MRIFLAYPSEEKVADSMARLAADLRGESHDVTTWPDPVTGGFIFEPIRANSGRHRRRRTYPC